MPEILAMDLDCCLLKMKYEPGTAADIRESLSLFHLFTMIGFGQILVFSGWLCLWEGVVLLLFVVLFLLSMTFP